MPMRLTFTVATALCLATATAAASAGGLPTPLPASQSWHDLGPARADLRVDIAIVLKYRHADQLDALLEAQGDDASPLYHHFLSAAQFEQYFAPTAADYSTTIAQLRSAGFSITNTFANRTLIDASAPAKIAARLFSTALHSVRRDDGAMRYINVRPATIPAALAATTLAVVGLDNAHALHPDYVRLGAASPRPAGVAAAAGRNPLFGVDGGYGPEVYRKSYGFPAGLTGQGRSSGVVTDADFIDSDIASYLKYFGVARTGPTFRVFVDGGPPRRVLSGDSIETTLDVETLVSLAPGTAMYVYEGPPMGSSLNFVDTYNQAVSDNKVDTLNTSYSECETLDPAFTSATEAIEAQGSALGITFHSSTGDVGTLTYGCGLNATVAVPAATVHNVAVGGSFEEVDHATGNETSETGWNDGSGSTGGGVSTVFKLPAYQQHVKNAIRTGRNIPDVSFDASAYTGESLFFDYNFNGPVGGTSVSSPIFGAGLAAINQLRHSRAGYFNPTLYKVWQTNGYVDGSTVYFRDLTSGNIGLYFAKRGYDQVTGIGAMLFANFAAQLP